MRRSGSLYNPWLMWAKGRWMLIGWTCAAGVVALGLSLFQGGDGRGGNVAVASTQRHIPPTSRPSRDRPPLMTPPNGRFDWIIEPGQTISSIRPKPGQWVKVSAGRYKAFSFPVAGDPENPIHYCFEPGAIIDGDHRDVAVEGAKNIHVQGMTIRNVRNGMQGEHAAVKIGDGVTLADCVIEDVTGAGLAIYGKDINILRTTFQRCGQLAFGTNSARNVLIKDCAILHCNNGVEDPPWKGDPNAVQIKGKWFANPDWESVSKIWTSENITIDGVESAYNVGPGLWTDYLNRSVTFKNCYLHDNRGLTDHQNWQGEGIRLELSPNEGPHKVINCLFERNSGAGVTLTSVRDVEITGNTFVGGIGVLFRNDDPRGRLTNIKVADNAFDRASIALWANRFPLVGMNIDGNTFSKGTKPLFSWDGVDYDSLAEVRRKLKFEQNGRME